MNTEKKRTLVVLGAILASASLPLTWTSLNGYPASSESMSGLSISHDFNGIDGSVLFVKNYWLAFVVVLSSLAQLGFYSRSFYVPAIACHALVVSGFMLLATATIRPLLIEAASPGVGVILCLAASILVLLAMPVWGAVGASRTVENH